MQLNPQSEKDDIKRVAHRLPCTIHSDGNLPTARAYCPFPEPLPSFRGRNLQNATYQIPSSSKLVMVERDTSDSNEDSQLCSFQLKHVLDNSIVHYEHDDHPSDDTSVPLALRWVSISQALHTPVELSKDEVEVVDTDTKKTSTAL